MKFAQQHRILGRMWGLREAWGPLDEWTDEGHLIRMTELYRCLTPQYIVSVFTEGMPSDRHFLEDLARFLQLT